MSTEFQPRMGSYYEQYRERLISVVVGTGNDDLQHRPSVETVELVDRDLTKRGERATWCHQNIANRLANEAFAGTVVLES